MNRADTGRAAYLNGLSAEASIEAHYTNEGCRVLARRWRSAAGEIDLIFARNDAVIFVEVKRAATLSRAAERLSDRQLARIFRAGEAFLAKRPNGALTASRVDFAMVDGTGRFEILENVQMV